MTASLITTGRWLRRRAEDVAVLLLMGMFLAFMIQIVFRYVFNWPLGWTSEFSILCWLWVVLWGAAFVTRRRTRSASTSSTACSAPTMRRRLTIVTGVGDRADLRHVAAGGDRLRPVHAGRADGLSQASASTSPTSPT